MAEFIKPKFSGNQILYEDRRTINFINVLIIIKIILKILKYNLT